jgi:hypothetical protein
MLASDIGTDAQVCVVVLNRDDLDVAGVEGGRDVQGGSGLV